MFYTYILSSSLNNSRLLFFFSPSFFFFVSIRSFLRSPIKRERSSALSDGSVLPLAWGLYSLPFSRVSSSNVS